MSINPQYEEADVDPKDVDASLDEAQMVADEKDEVLPEAPAVANIKVWIKGYGVMFTVRGEKMLDVVQKATTLVYAAISHGWKNRWDDPPAPGNVILPQPTSPQASTCGVHGTVMVWKTGVSKTSQKPYAFWACNTKNADGSFCQYRPEKK